MVLSFRVLKKLQMPQPPQGSAYSEEALAVTLQPPIFLLRGQ